MTRISSSKEERVIRMVISVVCIILLSVSLTFTSNADFTTNPYLIMPNELKGVTGEKLDVSSVFVQKVSANKVENVTDLEVIDDNHKAITTFPKEPYKAFLRRKDTKEIIGFILLTPTEKDNKVATGNQLTGEFLFYQKGRLFNKVSSAEEGKIYFYRQAKTPNTQPLILLIGDVEQGVLTYENYIQVGTSQIKIRRGK